MVFKHSPMSNDVACGSDHAYPATLDRAAGSDEQSWNTVSVETSRVDLCFSNEVWTYQNDLDFLQRQAEAQRRKAWNYRQNLKHRKWEAWERTTMLQEDTNTWANIPSDSSFGPSRSRSLRQHVLQMAIQCEKQHRQDLQALDVSLPRTPVEMRQRRSKSPLTEADIAEAKGLRHVPSSRSGGCAKQEIAFSDTFNGRCIDHQKTKKQSPMVALGRFRD